MVHAGESHALTEARSLLAFAQQIVNDTSNFFRDGGGDQAAE